MICGRGLKAGHGRSALDLNKQDTGGRKMGIKDKVASFLWGLMFKKGAKAGAKAVAAYLLSLPLEQYGISLDINQAAFIAAAVAIMEMGRNYLKQRWGVRGL